MTRSWYELPMKTLLFLTLLTSFSAIASDWVELSRANLATLLELQKKPMVKEDLRAYSSEKQTLLITGVPKTAKAVNVENKIFRHYVGSGMDKILACNCLKAGITPYIITNPGFGKEIYDDLYGIFLTTTTARPEEVGLNASAASDYIDVELEARTGLLMLEPKIFLVPGQGDIPTWMKPKYLEYQRTGICEPSMCSSFKRFDRRKGIDPMFIPVKIKCVSQNNVKKCS